VTTSQTGGYLPSRHTVYPFVYVESIGPRG